MPPPTQTPSKPRLNPLLSILILLIIAFAAWMIVARTAHSPSMENQAPAQPSLATQAPSEDPSLIGTVTYIQGLSLTTMAAIDDNPALTMNRMLIIALHSESRIIDAEGALLTPDAIQTGDRIAVWSATELTDEDSILAGDTVMVKP